MRGGLGAGSDAGPAYAFQVRCEFRLRGRAATWRARRSRKPPLSFWKWGPYEIPLRDLRDDPGCPDCMHKSHGAAPQGSDPQTSAPVLHPSWLGPVSTTTPEDGLSVPATDCHSVPHRTNTNIRHHGAHRW